MIRKILAAALVAAGLGALPGCGTDGDVGYVRLVNATTDFATMDLYADGDAAVSGVSSRTASGYAKISEGSTVLDVRNGGSGTSATQTTQTISTDHRYTLVAYVTGGAPTTQFLTDDEDAPSGANAKLRVLNGASTEAGSLDVYVTTNACSALGVTDVAIAAGVSGLQSSYATFGAASGTGTAYNVCATVAGSKSKVRFSDSITFTAGQVATLVLTPTSGGTLVDGLLINQQGDVTSYASQLARVRVVADAADASGVAVTIGGTEVADTVLSPTIGDYVAVPAGASTPVVTIGGVAVTAASQTFTAGADYTILVAGTAGAATVSVLTDDNSPSTDDSTPVKLRLVHGVNGLDTPVSLYVNNSPVIAGVPFGAAGSASVTEYDSVPLIAYSGTTTVWSLDSFTFVAQHNYTVFLLGTPSNVQTASSVITDR